MSLGDELDLLLQDRRLTTDDWAALATALEIPSSRLAGTNRHKRAVVNEALRSAYGHSLLAPVRGDFDPDYEVIVRATAEKLGVSVKKHHSVEDVEQRIVVELIDRAKEAIIETRGREAWLEIERRVEEDVRSAMEEGRLPAAEAERLRGLGGGAFLGALVAGRLAGFGLYVVANQAFFAMAKLLGLKVGVAVAGPIIGKSLAFLLGPAGFALGVLWFAYDLGDTNWRRVIPAVGVVALLRGRLRWEE